MTIGVGPKRIGARQTAGAALTVLAIFLLAGCPSGEVGNDVCLTCHNGRLAPDQTSFVVSAHQFLDCEGCHGPGKEHVRNGGRGGLFIVNPAREPFEQNHELCAPCHPTQAEQYLESGHAQEQAVRCTGCHDVHSPDKTVRSFTDNALCLYCHSDSGFPSVDAVVAHTFHPYDPTGTGASRCTRCHMPPLVRTDQAYGPHLHSLWPLAPITSNLAMDEGITPTPPNSCSGTMGCHDGTVVTAPVFNVDNPEDNAILQIIFDERYGEAVN